ncbi:HlyD family secretion protein [Desulfovibrio cuneatus]|uniref:HlyD family secretion protein n=1 Tax=Desulfovibrio cuneatus TaxID=159728 RepID=UPI000405F05E|nr:HlyD family efflux transporter periplasmic adaptor subunit [Desulfovibrio cuneatus]
MLELKLPKPAQKKNPVILLGIAAAVLCAVGGAFWWNASSQVVLEGARLSEARLPVTAEAGARVSEVFVIEGQTVAQGHPLFALAAEEKERIYAEAQTRLLEAEMQTPPEKLRLVRAKAGKNAGPLTLGEQLEQLFLDEKTTRANVATLAEAEARAAIALNRAQIQPQNKRPASNEMAALAAAHENARQELARSREMLEKFSGERAQLERDMGLIRQAQQQENIPEKTAVARAQVYEEQLARVAEAKAALEAMVIITPAAGTVRNVQVKNGSILANGGLALEITPDNVALRAEGLLSMEEARKIATGMPCEITVPGHSQKHLAGQVDDVRLIPIGGGRTKEGEPTIEYKYLVTTKINQVPPELAPQLSQWSLENMPVEVRINVGKPFGSFFQ